MNQRKIQDIPNSHKLFNQIHGKNISIELTAVSVFSGIVHLSVSVLCFLPISFFFVRSMLQRIVVDFDVNASQELPKPNSAWLGHHPSQMKSSGPPTVSGSSAGSTSRRQYTKPPFKPLRPSVYIPPSWVFLDYVRYRSPGQ